MKQLKFGCLLLLLGIAQLSYASVITNGSFDNCSYSGWMKDTDGFGDISTQNDFMLSAPPGCAAIVNVDSFNTDAWFANTLYQDINLQSGQQYQFTAELSVNSELTSSDFGFIADYFFVAFGDGSGKYLDESGALGSVLNADIDGAASYSIDIMLSETLSSISNLTLEFQLLIGFDQFGSDFGGSWLQIDNVAITPSNANMQVNAPSHALLIGLGLAGIFFVRKHRKSGGEQ